MTVVNTVDVMGGTVVEIGVSGMRTAAIVKTGNKSNRNILWSG